MHNSNSVSSPLITRRRYGTHEKILKSYLFLFPFSSFTDLLSSLPVESVSFTVHVTGPLLALSRSL